MDKEMLCVERSKVADIYAYNDEILKTDPTHGGAVLLKAKLQELFGDKCLPDNVESLADNVDSSGPNVESNTEPQQTKDNMEEKELDLCELLKGCEGEKFYSRAYGEVTLNEIIRDNRPNSHEIRVYTSEPQSDRIWFLRDGRKHENGEIDLYPSRFSFLANPLNAKQAWEEWSERRKPTDFLVSWRREDEKLHGSDGFSRISLPDAETEKLIDSIKNVIESFRKNYEQHPQV